MIDVFAILDRHAGFLGFAPRRAIHRGGPSVATIRRIQSLTHTDASGRAFYRKEYGGPLMRLRGAAAFCALNKSINAVRPHLFD